MSTVVVRQNVVAGRILRLACLLGLSDEDPSIEWYRNGQRLSHVKGTDYQEFLKDVGTNSYICRSGNAQLKTVVNVSPMKVDDCSNQPYGCCAKGYVPATSQLHESCDLNNPVPCASARYGCCPKQKVSAIGRHHLACKHRYIHPSRCEADSQSFLNAIKQCVQRRGKKNVIGQLRYHVDVTTKRCLPVAIDTECESVKSIPLFESPQSCRQSCIVRNKNERCFLHHVIVPNAEHCPSPRKIWYFDIWTKDCLSVRNPKDCLLNSNRFLSATACTRECKYPSYTRNVPECLEPKAEGTCRKRYGYSHFYYYNYAKGQCQKFQYTGCHGTLNRFMTLRKCEARCQGKSTPKVLEKICALKRNVGHCPLSPIHIRRWYHDPQDKTCKEMQYTQCGGNANNFESQKECTEACGAKMPVDVCALPANSGDCLPSRSFRRYRFDTASMRCVRFNFTGCGGNANNFLTLRECNEACLSRATPIPLPPPVQPRDPVDVNRLLDYEPCQKEQSIGDCRSTAKTKVTGRRGVDRWYFNVRDGTCQSFRYTGCGGTPNIYDTRFDCERKCQERLRKVPRKCKRQVRGSCIGVIGDEPVFTYDTALGRCVQKHLSYQCRNRQKRYFTTVQECQKECRPPPPKDDHLSDVCYVTPQKYSLCPDYQKTQRWHFSVKEGQCVSYTTCPYTEYFGNSHPNKTECLRLCQPAYIRDVCTLPSDPGKCTKNNVRRMFSYDAKTRKCNELWYTGCLGNRNRFVTYEECRSFCDAEMKLVNAVIPTPIKPNISLVEQRPEYYFYSKKMMKVCNVPFTSRHVGSCKDDSSIMPRWFFKNGECHRFHYYGCGALLNYFDTQFDCEDICLRQPDDKETSALAVQTVCHLPPYAGKCNKKTKRWFSDGRTGTCKPYVGCASVSNSFDSESQCLTTCYPTQKIDICRLQKDAGLCSTPTVRWYYDISTRKCRQFIYGGCHGNSNRFVTRLECESACHRSDPCRLPSDAGDKVKNRWVQRFFYNVTSSKCEHFWFSGSGGNANRFNKLASCKRTCEPTKTDLVPPKMRDQTFSCLQPIWEDLYCEKGKGRTKIFAYYNSETQRCENKKFKVCNGRILYGNRFESLQICQEQCEALKVIKENNYERCAAKPPDPKYCSKWILNWFYNQDTKKCEKFWYGQCPSDRVENRFENQIECENTCQQVSTTVIPFATIHIDIHEITTNRACPVCSNYCSYGYIVVGSCATCECYDPCLGHKCPDGQECRVTCNKNKEKCHATCGSGKIEYERPDNDCRISEFGCCPDSQKVAESPFLITCPPVKPRAISNKRSNLMGLVQSPVTILCNVTAAPKAEIDWYHNNYLIPFGSEVHYGRYLKKDYQLQISNVERLDFGTWRCKATNRYGSVTHSSYLSLIEAPRLIKMSPKRLKIERDHSVILSCVAEGIPKPAIRWFFSKTPRGVRNIIAADNSTFFVPRMNEQSEGYYFCEADNGIKGSPEPGEVENKATHRMHLILKRPLSAYVDVYPYSRRVFEGHPMRLKCRVKQAPRGSRILWFHDSRIINSSQVTYPEQRQSLVQVSVAKLSDAGRYTCMLSDHYGAIKYYNVFIHVNRDSSMLPQTCRDRIHNCMGLIESLRNDFSCKGTIYEQKCCRTCFELGKLSLADVYSK